MKSLVYLVRGEASRVYLSLKSVPAHDRQHASKLWFASMNEEQLLEVFTSAAFTDLPPAVRRDVAARLAADVLLRQATVETDSWRGLHMRRLVTNLRIAV